MTGKTYKYCCICGAAVPCDSDHETGWSHWTEAFCCGTHTQAEVDDYVSGRNPGYCSECGFDIALAEGETRDVHCCP